MSQAGLRLSALYFVNGFLLIYLIVDRSEVGVSLVILIEETGCAPLLSSRTSRYLSALNSQSATQTERRFTALNANQTRGVRQRTRRIILRWPRRKERW